MSNSEEKIVLTDKIMNNLEEITILNDKIKELQEIIKNMRSCTVCEYLTLFSDEQEPCVNCGDFKHFKLRSKKENEKT